VPNNNFRNEEDGFYIDVDGFQGLVDDLEQMEEAIEAIMVEEFTKYGFKLEEAARALAPEDEGDLAASIIFSGLRVASNGVEGDVGSNLAYALRRHEEPYREGLYPKYSKGAKFPDYYEDGRGLGTVGKSYKGYQAGRKYLENAVKALDRYYEDMLARIRDRATEGFGE
jgi:hypothetical protein